MIDMDRHPRKKGGDVGRERTQKATLAKRREDEENERGDRRRDRERKKPCLCVECILLVRHTLLPRCPPGAKCPADGTLLPRSGATQPPDAKKRRLPTRDAALPIPCVLDESPSLAVRTWARARCSMRSWESGSRLRATPCKRLAVMCG